MQLLLVLLLCLTWCQVKSDRLEDSIPGDPGLDYPLFASIPSTEFQCVDKDPGYYADIQARCQVFHVCHDARKSSFLCPNGTLFNQKFFVCDWWFNVDCERAPSLYPLNQNLFVPKAPPPVPQATPSFERFRTAPPPPDTSTATPRIMRARTPSTTTTNTPEPTDEDEDVKPSKQPTYFEPVPEIPLGKAHVDEDFNSFTTPTSAQDGNRFQATGIQTTPAPKSEPVSLFNMIADLDSQRSTIVGGDKWIFLVNDPNMIANLEDAARRDRTGSTTPPPFTLLPSSQGLSSANPQNQRSQTQLNLNPAGPPIPALTTSQNQNTLTSNSPKPTTSSQVFSFGSTVPSSDNHIQQHSSNLQPEPFSFQPSNPFPSSPSSVSFVSSANANQGFQPSFAAQAPFQSRPPNPSPSLPSASVSTEPFMPSTSFQPSFRPDFSTSAPSRLLHPNLSSGSSSNSQGGFPIASPLNISNSPSTFQAGFPIKVPFNPPRSQPTLQTGLPSFAPTPQVIHGKPAQPPNPASPSFYPSTLLNAPTAHPPSVLSPRVPKMTFQTPQGTQLPQTNTLSHSNPSVAPYSITRPTSFFPSYPTSFSTPNRPSVSVSSFPKSSLFSNGVRASLPMTQFSSPQGPTFSSSVVNPSSHVQSFFSLPDVSPNPANGFTKSTPSFSSSLGNNNGNGLQQPRSVIPVIPTTPSQLTTLSTTPSPPPTTTRMTTPKARQVWALDTNAFWPTTNSLKPSAVPRKWDVSTAQDPFSSQLLTARQLSYF